MVGIMKHVLGLALLFLYCTSAHGYTTKLLSEIPQQGRISAIAFNSATDTVAAVSVSAQSLTIIDAVSYAVTHSIPLPMEPMGVAIHSGTNRAVVTSKSGSLLLYDLNNGDLINTIDIGTQPYSIAIDEGRNRALIGVDGGIRVVDLATGEPGSEINCSGKTVLLSYGKNGIIAVSNDESQAKLRLINETSGYMLTEIALPGEVLSIGMDEQLNYLLVTLMEMPGIFIYKADILKPLDTIRSDKRLQIISVNSSTHMAALADTLNGSLTIADLTSRKVVDLVQLYGQMGPLHLDMTRNKVFVARDQGLMVVHLENPVPRITGLLPPERAAGADGFLLSISGEKFVKDSRTRFNKGEFSSIFRSNEAIEAEIPAEQLLTPGDVSVSVVNPPPGGGRSNELKFTILTPAPALSGISPAVVAVGGPPFTLRVEGTNFLPSADVSFNGKKVRTNFVSSTLLEASIDAAQVSAVGIYPVSVRNNGPDKFNSNTVTIRVVSAEEAAVLKKSGVAPAVASQGTGSLEGTILNTEMQPLSGVTIRTKGISTRTDAEGKFILKNIPAGKRTILMDGSTAEDIEGRYPNIPITVHVEAGHHHLMPFTPYFHRQKSRNFKEIDPKTETVLTDPEVHGFEMRIPKGVRIIGWDGKPNVKVSVRTLPPDRLPVKPLPKNANVRTVYMFHFDKVGGGKPDRPIPVKAPNDLGLLPGEKAVLWYYDESQYEGEAPNDWAIAGTGTVTRDGRYIVSDPGVGIPKFCCGATAYGGSGAGSPPSGPGGGSGDPGSGGGGDGITPETCDQNDVGGNAGDPVNLATGYFLHDKVDYKVNGSIPFEIKRFYRSGDEGWGAFGTGTYFGFDWWVGDYGSMLLLLKPGNYRYRFSKQPDGTYANTTDPEYLGDVFYRNADNTFTLKKKDGWNFTFGTDRLLNQIKNPNGKTLTFFKEIDGNISRIVLPEGGQITIDYQLAGVLGRDRLIGISGPSGTVNYTHSDGKLQSVQYPDGSSVSYGYDSSGRMNTVIENGKTVVANVYNADNRVVSQSRPDGALYTFSYILAGGNITETRMTGPNGALTKWRFYDDAGTYRNGYVASMTTPDGETRYERAPGTNLVKSITDPLGRVTSYTYDAKGRTLTKTDPVRNSTSYQYDNACSRVTQITDPLQKITRFAYTFATDSCRPVRSEIRDPLQNLTVLEYNGNGMPTKITDPNKNTTTVGYDPANPTKPASIADSLSNTFRYSYDALGRCTSVTDAKDATTTFGHDGVTERIASVTDPLGKITRYSYDLSGNLTSVTDAKGTTIYYEYDDRNRIIKTTDQLGRSESYSYYRGSEIIPTTGDNMKSITDRKGQVTAFNQYDPMNRLKRQTFADGSAIQYVYDAAGRVTNINDSVSGAIGYAYNDHGCPTCSGRGVDRISRETTPLGTVSYTYDHNGRRSMTVGGEPVVNYGYDDAGRLKSLSRMIGSGIRTYKIDYDDGSRRKSIQIPLSSGTSYVTTAYGYDNANRITSMLLTGGAATIEKLAYAYDPNSNRTSFSRNAAQPLSPAMSGTVYDEANQMLAFNGKNLTYDDNGNLKSKTGASGTTNYTWDARNRLVAINGPSLTATFGYDAANRRISKTVNGTMTQYVYDGWDIIQEISPGTKENYVRTLSIDEPLTRLDGTTIRHYVRDALGSVIGLADDSGASVATYIYDAFGVSMVSGGTSTNPFQFTGRENDRNGLYHYRYRYYSPEMQRFISEDPTRFLGGINYFSYVDNNPVNKKDPMGLAPFCCNLNNCLNACAMGGRGFLRFCGSLPDPRLRATCYAMQFAGETACRGWCFLYCK